MVLLPGHTVSECTWVLRHDRPNFSSCLPEEVVAVAGDGVHRPPAVVVVGGVVPHATVVDDRLRVHPAFGRELEAGAEVGDPSRQEQVAADDEVAFTLEEAVAQR